jgi:hypothetical protein
MSTWVPQPRPDWVATLNTVGRDVGATALVPLDEASLLEAARQQTGLQDFGDDDWREPFGLLVRDLEDAELTLTGRLLARIDIVKSLVVRLQMSEQERLHPEILEQPVVGPIFITGLGRTGTSILVELIGQDPVLRPALGWEYRHPCPPSERGRPDPVRIAATAAEIELWHHVTPELPAIHETAVDEPDEDSMGQMHAFVSPIWSATHRAPNLESWVGADNGKLALRFHRRLLRHLQWKKPGRFILKNPGYLSCLPNLFAEFPDARVVQTHRDPLKVLASTADMLATVRWQRTDTVDFDAMAKRITFGYPFLLDMVTKQRDSGVLPADRIVDICYADLLTDHLGTISAVYKQLGMELTDVTAARMAAYLEAKPKDRHGPRSYAFESLGADRLQLREQFAPYMARFGVPEEL